MGDAEALASYVPAWVQRRLSGGGGEPPWAERRPVAVLSADISGSTALAERLSERGPDGAEELSRVFGDFFSPLIDLVIAQGGDVVKFTGDGLFAVWPAGDGKGGVTATAQAARCGLAAQAALCRRNDAGSASPHGDLSMRIGIGVGEVTGICVSWAAEHCEFLAVGTPIAEACAAERQAGPGEVVVSAEVWNLIADRSQGVELGTAAARLLSVQPLAVADSAPRSAPSVELEASLLRPYVHPAALSRIDAGYSGWLAELRRVTALFIQLPDWRSASAEEVQDTVARVQQVLHRFEGTVLRLGMSATGPVVKAGFGMPRSHGDDASRAVRAALEIQGALAEVGIAVDIGIASGRAFLGEVGNAQRREYTSTGEVVHTAARLMQRSAGILCDGPTRQACGDRVRFDDLPELRLRGLSSPVAAFRPRASTAATVSRRRSRGALLGRRAEQEQLRQAVADVVEGRLSQFLLISAEAGMGKSRLVEELQRLADTAGATALVGAGEAVEIHTAYHAWRPILMQLLDLDPTSSTESARRSRARAALARADKHLAGAPIAELAPLLNPILGLDFSETEASERITGEARADVTHELIVSLLQYAAHERPLVVVLEDAHWLDSASWAVAELMAARIRPLLVVAAARPMEDPQPPAYRRLRAAPDFEQIDLRPLDREDSAGLIADRLGAQRVSEPVTEIIFGRAGGQPFFTEELTHALRDAGTLHVDGDECRLAPAAGDPRQLRLPDSIEATVTGRIDLLGARQQLALKVASIFGQIFSLDALERTYPISEDRLRLRTDLVALEDLDLVHHSPAEGDTYRFKHAITRDVAYELLPYAQRRSLHQAAARWYEESHAGDLAPVHAVLAHHWSRAVDFQAPDTELGARAVDALERAGEQSMASYANSEAVRFLEDALRLQRRLNSAVDPDGRRRARWLRHLADAKNRLGIIPAAIAHALSGLEMLGQPFPRGKLRRSAGIAAELARQIGHRLHSAATSTAGDERQRCLEAAHLYELLGLMWYITLDGIPATLANLRAVNLAERAGPSVELATSSSMVGLSAGVLLGPRFSEHYFRQGEEAARGAGDRYGYGRICYTRGLVYTGTGRWSEADAAFDEALATFSEIGEARWRDLSCLSQGVGAYLRGRHAEALERYRIAGISARERGDVQAQAYVSVGFAGSLIAAAKLEEALAECDRLASWLAHNFSHMADRGAQLISYGLRAIIHCRLGQADEALAAIHDQLRLVRESPALTFYVLTGASWTAEACLRLWEQGRVREALIAPLAKQAIANLGKLARLYPVARPAYRLWSGVGLQLQGRTRRARATWIKAANEATELRLPREKALAFYEIGRHAQPADPERDRNLRRAAEILHSVELAFELGEVKRAMQPPIRHGRGQATFAADVSPTLGSHPQK